MGLDARASCIHDLHVKYIVQHLARGGCTINDSLRTQPQEGHCVADCELQAGARVGFAHLGVIRAWYHAQQGAEAQWVFVDEFL